MIRTFEMFNRYFFQMGMECGATISLWNQISKFPQFRGIVRLQVTGVANNVETKTK